MKALSQTAKTTRIRELNDAFRRTFAGGKVTMTAGVDALPDMVKAAALQKAAQFDEFNEDNDPHGEHDFGSFDLCGRKFFWKIELYEEPGVKSKKSADDAELSEMRLLAKQRAMHSTPNSARVP